MFKCKEDFDERVQRFDAAKGPALAVWPEARLARGPEQPLLAAAAAAELSKEAEGPTGNVCGVDVMVCAAWPE